jgi:pyrroloquinoline quinone biosynthesis protein B
MLIRVLGSAAGGGFPQWNCNCGNCAAARVGNRHVLARTQTSIAVSGDGVNWTVLDASPDLREQIGRSAALQPSADDARRASPIKAVVVTGFEIDQVAGLLSLREGQEFCLHATSFVLGSLRGSAVFNVLVKTAVSRRTIKSGKSFEPFDGAQIEITPLSVPSKIPFHHEAKRELDGGETIGLVVRDTRTGKRAAYIPSCAEVTNAMSDAIDGVDVLLFDGTLFTDRELVEQALSDKTGAMMGHISISGPHGAIKSWRDTAIARRIFIHLNNSNPVLRDDSRERQLVNAAGWDVAHDGMELMI